MCKIIDEKIVFIPVRNSEVLFKLEKNMKIPGNTGIFINKILI